MEVPLGTTNELVEAEFVLKDANVTIIDVPPVLNFIFIVEYSTPFVGTERVIFVVRTIT